LNKELIAELEARQTIREQSFQSSVPIIGPLISWFRATWNSISTRWYVLPLAQQQSEFNALLVSYLQRMEAAVNAQLSEMRELLNEADARTIGTDQDQTQLTRNVAELSYQLTHLIRLSEEMNATLKGPEDDDQASATGNSGEG
jgi:hypothetical protein